MSNSLWPHGLQLARLPYPSLSTRVCSNSDPLSKWWYLAISSSAAPTASAFNLSQHQGLFQGVGCSHQVAKVLELQLQHQSFHKYSGLISFRINWFDLLAIQGTLKSLQHNNSKASVLQDSAFFMNQHLHPYMTTGKTRALTRQI